MKFGSYRRPSALLSTLLAFATLVTVCSTDECFAASARRKVVIDQDAFGPAGSNLQSHTLRLLEIAQRTEVPVHPGAVLPLLNTQSRTKVWERLYGKLFYKGAWTEVWPAEGAVRRTPYHADPYLVPPSPAGEPRIKPAHESAASFLSRKVREFPGQVTIVAAGPLTNLAMASRLDPEFASLARELVFMGGSFNPVAADNGFAAEYANAPRREFNMRWDPEAASIVLHEPWKKITEVPIDPTTRTFFKPEFIQEVARGQAPFAAYLGRFGQSFPMWDELAVAVWLDPSIVTRSTALLVDVDTSFTAGYGDTLSWSIGEGPGLGERPVTVVFDVDVPKFERMSLDLLKAPTPAH